MEDSESLHCWECGWEIEGRAYEVDGYFYCEDCR